MDIADFSSWILKIQFWRFFYKLSLKAIKKPAMVGDDVICKSVSLSLLNAFASYHFIFGSSSADIMLLSFHFQTVFRVVTSWLCAFSYSQGDLKKEKKSLPFLWCLLYDLYLEQEVLGRQECLLIKEWKKISGFQFLWYVFCCYVFIY